jgi:hypothetical protein
LARVSAQVDAMPQQLKKEAPVAAKSSSGRAATPASPSKTGGGTPALVGQVQRANYTEGAALVAPGNAQGYVAGKEAARPAAAAKPKQEAAAKPSKVVSVDPSKEMLANAHKKELGHGGYTQTWAGASAENEPKPKIVRERKDGKTGEPELELASGTATAGVGARVGIGGKAEKQGKYGKASILGDVHAGAEAGANAKYKIGSSGAELSANAAAKAGVEVSGAAEVETAKVFGQTAGVGAKGKGFAGARVGAGGKVAITKEFVGAKGQIGGFAGAEASGELAAHVGPVGGKVTAAAQAGIGASLDGEISYDHGKLKLSGRAAVALGVGLSLGTSVEIDIGAALKMGGAIAAAAARASAHSVSQVAATLGSAWGSVAHWFGL